MTLGVIGCGTMGSALIRGVIREKVVKPRELIAWDVDKKRVKKLLSEEKITESQAKIFIEKGALGSHMENLQRRQGFKGFNQDSVTAIIHATDPRKAEHGRGA